MDTNDTQKTPEILITEKKDSKLREIGIIILLTLMLGGLFFGVLLWGVHESYGQIKTLTPVATNELTNLRTTNSETFELPNGQRQIKLYLADKYESDLTTTKLFTVSPITPIDTTPSKSVFLKILGNDVWAATSTASSNTKDGEIIGYAANVNTNYGSQTFMRAGRTTATDNIYHSLINFTTPNISGTITSASIYLYQVNTEMSGTPNIGVYPITAQTDWIESEFTWIKAHTSGANHSWNTAGGDYGSLITATSSTATSIFWKWDLQGGSQTGTPLTMQFNTDYGLLFRIIDDEVSQNEYSGFKTKEETTANLRPYLLITYTPGPSITSFYPATASVGSTITLNGTNFTNPSTISIGGLNFTNFNYTNDTQVYGNVPNGASTNYIVIQSTGGYATSSTQLTISSSSSGTSTSSIDLTITNQRINYIIIIGIFALVFTFFDFMRRTLIKK